MLAVRFVPSFVETMATKVALPKPYQVHPGTQLDGGCSNLRALVPEDAINLFLIYREIHCKHFAFKSRPMESHTSDFACTAGPVSVATRRAVAASDSSCSQLRWSTQVGATPSIPSLISRYIKQSLTRIYRVALGATDQLRVDFSPFRIGVQSQDEKPRAKVPVFLSTEHEQSLLLDIGWQVG